MGPHFYGHTAHVIIYMRLGSFGRISWEWGNESRSNERLGNLYSSSLDIMQISSNRYLRIDVWQIASIWETLGK